ncbi:MAG TPA: DivIVA domain-containing protein [Acidimicrobiales bacterium]|jgi:DivIVA domain-containing protein|nr:DivIVA domain-containing protein [Acidimicrobiales bacterium]
MSLRPEDIATRQFTTAFRGLDKGEVYDHLRAAAGDYQAAVERSAAAEAQLAEVKARLERAEDLVLAADGACEAAQSHLSDLETDHDAPDRLGRHVTEVIRSAAVAARSIQAEAEEWAADRRRDAGQEAALVQQASRHQADQARKQAERVLAEARNRAEEILGNAERNASELTSRADKYARGVVTSADQAARDIRDAAERDAGRRLAAAEHEASSLIASAQHPLSRFRVNEVELRSRLESAVAWIKRSIEAPRDESPKIVPPGELPRVTKDPGGAQRMPELGPGPPLADPLRY